MGLLLKKVLQLKIHLKLRFLKAIKQKEEAAGWQSLLLFRVHDVNRKYRPLVILTFATHPLQLLVEPLPLPLLLPKDK